MRISSRKVNNKVAGGESEVEVEVEGKGREGSETRRCRFVRVVAKINVDKKERKEGRSRNKSVVRRRRNAPRIKKEIHTCVCGWGGRRRRGRG
jgi:hypothetical protein